MADVPSAVPYGTAAQGQSVFGYSASSAAWGYSPWDNTTVTSAAGGNAGAAPPAPAVTSGSTICRGSLTFGSGTGPAAGSMATVAFSATLPTAPVVMIEPTNAAGATLSTFVESITTTGFTVGAAVAPTASQANTIYGVSWYLAL